VAAEANAYAYVENSPVSRIDPGGTFVWFIPVVVFVVRAAILVGRVTAFVARYGPGLTAATAAAWLKWRGYRWGDHLTHYAISYFNIARAVAFGQRIWYLHDRICKLGFYLSGINLFVASNPRTMWLFTAFHPRRGVAYVRGLSPCP
jgi:hypothetical protein